MKRSVAIACALIFIGGLFYYLASMTPLAADNYVFSRQMIPNFAQVYSGAPIISLKPMTLEAAFAQAWDMYLTWCGRFTGNLAVYLLFMLPGWLYELVAAAMFTVYIFLLQLCVFGRAWRERISAKWILAMAGLIWVGIPSFGEAFFWLSVGGQIALLGQALVFIPFRFALDAPLTKKGVLFCVLLFLLGAAVASLDFPTSAALPVTGLLCVLWLYRRDGRKAVPGPLALTGGLCLGGMLTLAAPGNAQRMLQSADPNVIAYIASGWGERIFAWLGNLPQGILFQYLPLSLILLGCLILRLRYKKDWIGRLPLPCLLFITPAALTYGAYLFTAWPQERAFATPFMQLTVAGCMILASARPLATPKMAVTLRFLTAMFTVWCLLSVIFTIDDFRALHKEIQAREQIMASGIGKTVRVPEIFYKRDRHWPLGSLSDANEDPDFWVNRFMAAYYGLEKLIVGEPLTIIYKGAPEELFARIYLDGNRLHIRQSASDSAPRELHFYYYGDRSLLSRLPKNLGKKIFAWLSDAAPDDLRQWLIPMLLARVDIPLASKDGSVLLGKSIYLHMNDKERIWLVKPGGAKYSFDLLPLEKSCCRPPGSGSAVSIIPATLNPWSGKPEIGPYYSYSHEMRVFPA